MPSFRFTVLEHDPEKWKPVFPRDKCRRHLRGDHVQTKRLDDDSIKSHHHLSLARVRSNVLAFRQFADCLDNAVDRSARHLEWVEGNERFRAEQLGAINAS
jgi:hypothetical protein